MKNFLGKINRIEDLAAVDKDLSPDSLEELQKHLKDGGNVQHTIKYLYNGAYNQAVSDVLEILRDPENDSYTWEELQKLRSEKAKDVTPDEKDSETNS